ncbi:GNAT family N-acetyltransferase [uncultured Cyclobacterium sp.]|uniref:GNAT family N-acetyltransferase n=1 Tax=uncultured Cyclobacterium sp. TaxID=453820 RepID=UPI0030EEB79E
MSITISETREIDVGQIVALYKANKWSAAEKPHELKNALLNSHSLISAWDKESLIGIGNAVSDGYLVVYFPHLLVHPDYQGKGIGKRIVAKFQEKYKDFHMQILTADHEAIPFYKKVGFEKAGETMSMWIYKGNDH